jgi:hypothetical protein
MCDGARMILRGLVEGLLRGEGKLFEEGRTAAVVVVCCATCRPRVTFYAFRDAAGARWKLYRGQRESFWMHFGY